MRVQFTKYPDTPHWRHEPLVRLGEDDHGLWFGATTETWLQKGDVPVPKNMHEDGFFCRNPFVQLVVPGAWWTMHFNGDERDVTHYIDVVAPAEINDDEIRFVDLDLDVVRLEDGAVMLDDEDEFLVHSRTLGYPEFWIDKARSTAADLAGRLERLEDPFGDAARAWRTQLLSR